MEITDDISIERIQLIENLSVRAKNVCINSDLNSLKSILDFYNTHKSFVKIQNCGFNTNTELVNVCKKYANIYLLDQNISFPKNDDNSLIFDIFKYDDIIIKKLSFLNTLQVSLFNEYFKQTLNVLYPKAYKTLAFKIGLTDPVEVFAVFLNDNFNYKHIKKTIVSDIKKFIVSLKDYIEILESFSTKELISEYIKLIVINNNIKNTQNNIQQEIENVFDENENIKLFALINLLIKFSEIILNDKYEIFLHSFSNVNDEKLSLEAIGKMLNLTRERVRQKRSKLEYGIIYYFKDVIKVLINYIVNYNIELRTVNIIDNNVTEKINKNENVAYNFLFYNKIFNSILNIKDTELDIYDSIYGLNKTKDGINYQNSYLIKRKILQSFDFKMFIKDIDKREKTIKARAYELDFTEYLKSFIINKNNKFFDEIQYICKAIILNEYDHKINQEGLLIFKRTSGSKIEEYCLEILEEAGIPLTLNKINELIKLKYDAKGFEINSIRFALSCEKKTFIFFGRSSIYGLKKWENSKLNIKGGTIRDIVEEYLAMWETPQHITEIFEYVSKYRKTSLYSVQRNIVSDTHNRFVLFKNSHVGISGKEYTENNILIKFQKGTWYKHYNELLEFLKNNNNILPRNYHKDKSEIALHNFCYNTKRAYNKGRLDADKIELLKSINFSFEINNPHKNSLKQYI